MTRVHTLGDRNAELEFHASGFLVKVEGTWTDTALAQFRHFLKLRHLAPSATELQDTLGLAKEKILRRGKPFVYLCRPALLQQDRLRYFGCRARSFESRAWPAYLYDRLSGAVQTSPDRFSAHRHAQRNVRPGDHSRRLARRARFR